MQIYQQSAPIEVQEKSDHSPVTAADLAAHQIIKQRTCQYCARYSLNYLKKILPGGVGRRTSPLATLLAD